MKEMQATLEPNAPICLPFFISLPSICDRLRTPTRASRPRRRPSRVQALPLRKQLLQSLIHGSQLPSHTRRRRHDRRSGQRLLSHRRLLLHHVLQVRLQPAHHVDVVLAGQLIRATLRTRLLGLRWIQHAALAEGLQARDFREEGGIETEDVGYTGLLAGLGGW